jgi:hypothetical protein
MNKISPDCELDTGKKKESTRPYVIKIPSVNNIQVKNKNSNKIIESQSCCSHLCSSLPLICKNLKLKLQDDLLLGEEHSKKISKGFVTPENRKIFKLTSDEKTEIVLDDPKFGMFSLFKYHLRRGYLNNELKKTNKIYCSHIFSLLFALPIIVFITQWIMYISLLQHEIKKFDGNFCPNDSSLEKKLMMFGIGLIYFIKSFFIWDNLTNRIGLKKMHRIDSITVILDTFQEFLFNLLVFGANLWIIFVETDIQNMILNSLAMEFLMKLDNEFEELYFKNLPGAAEDIFDTMYVSFEFNRKLVKKKYKTNKFFKCVSCLLYLPYKLLLISIFCFPVICIFITIFGPLCK